MDNTQQNERIPQRTEAQVITLNPQGEQLKTFYDNHQTIPFKPTAIGKHAYCGGLIWRTKISHQLSVLSCDECNMRVFLQLSVHTFEELHNIGKRQKRWSS